MNYDRYIGLPYKENGRDDTGIDCWGLARLFYKNELAIELPSYSELYNGSSDPKLPQTIDYYKDNWTKVDQPQTGDLCLFNILGEPTHVGVYIGDGKFLHSRDGKDSVIDRLDSTTWFKRLDGFYRYTEKFSLLPIAGSPNPLQWNSFVEFAQPGANAQGFADYLTAKYKLSDGFKKQLILMIDGVPVPQERWNSTYFAKDSIVNYKVVAQGRSPAGRMFAFFAVVVAAMVLGPIVGELGMNAVATAQTVGGIDIAASIGTLSGWQTAGTLAVQFAGMALVNAAFPIRPPKDPGQGIPTNLFSGTQNQANPFGAIPVVLGRTRVTGLLAAAPFLETLERTSKMHLLVVWGFGPLYVDRSTLMVGSTSLSKILANGSSDEVAITLEGSEIETSSERTTFNATYPTDVQQKPSGQSVELVNDYSGTGGSQVNPWKWFTFDQPATSIDIALNFPDGLRKINKETGDTASAKVTISVVAFPQQYGDAATLDEVNPTLPTANIVKPYELTSNTTIDIGSIPANYSGYDGDGNYYDYPLYRKTVVAIKNNGTINSFSGGISETNGSNPTNILAKALYRGTYSWVYEIDSTGGSYEVPVPDDDSAFKWEPKVPTDQGWIVLFSYIQQGSTIISSQDMRSSNFTFSGLTSTYTGTKVTIATGSIASDISPVETDLILFNSSAGVSGVPYTFTNTVNVTSNKWTNPFLKANAVWPVQTGTSIPQATKTITLTKSGMEFPYTGWYSIDLAADNWAKLFLDGGTTPIITSEATWDTNVNEYNSPANSVRQRVYITKGTHSITLEATNNETGNQSLSESNCGVALRISFLWDGTTNVNPSSIVRNITLDRNEKDGFNYIYKLEGPLVRTRYTVGIKRISSSVIEDGDWQNIWRSYLYTATAYDSQTPALNPLPVRTWKNYTNATTYTSITNSRNLARSAIVVQSTNKVNGTIEGLNALVQTIALDWNGTAFVNGVTNGTAWVERPTNNPASLFRHVLQHTANTFPISDNELDLVTLQEWHTFCQTEDAVTGRPRLTYNNVISSTQSLMDVLRDICAAGMGSPTFINGKWSVVIDKVRPYTVQHFTPHNSWGFESTKLLVRIPHAFRISFPNELKAYQLDEIIVYDTGYDKEATNGNKVAEQFEQIQFPGITNPQQIKFFAKWHLAQLHKRPERYTLNVDFEYLVCSRGDKVKVTHDVPLWGTGSARIKSISTVSGSTVIVLTEPILFDVSKIASPGYKMLVRKNPSAGATGILEVPNVTLSIEPITITNNTVTVAAANDYYNIVRVTSGSTSGVEVDNLVMLGETNKVSQDLIVLSVEPSSNTTARLLLTDYAEDMYTTDIDSLSTVFEPNITLNNAPIVKVTIGEKPEIIEVNTSDIISSQISNGNYVNTTLISFANPPSKIKNAAKIQIEIIEASQLFDVNNTKNTYFIEKDSSFISIIGLKTDMLYKIRARYTNSNVNIFGPWTDEKMFLVSGKNLNNFNATSIDITLEGTNLLVRPILAAGTVAPNDHRLYEFRLYKNSGSGDFWDKEYIPIDKEVNYLEQANSSMATFDLLKLPQTAGIITGSITGTVLTVTAITSGGVVIDGIVSGTGVLDNTLVVEQLTSTETTGEKGKRGTYTISQTQTVASGTITILSQILDDDAPGIQYRIACRAVNGTGNYSTTSLLGSINLRTIQPPTLTSGD